jgi:hypothetical protein
MRQPQFPDKRYILIELGANGEPDMEHNGLDAQQVMNLLQWALRAVATRVNNKLAEMLQAHQLPPALPEPPHTNGLLEDGGTSGHGARDPASPRKL